MIFPHLCNGCFLFISGYVSLNSLYALLPFLCSFSYPSMMKMMMRTTATTIMPNRMGMRFSMNVMIWQGCESLLLLPIRDGWEKCHYNDVVKVSCKQNSLNSFRDKSELCAWLGFQQQWRIRTWRDILYKTDMICTTKW